MKKTITLFCTTMLSLSLHAQIGNASNGADMIVHHAKITTQVAAQPSASALAIKGGRIYAVGNDAEILALKDAHTQVIDAHGRRLIPGLEDSHLHPLNERNFNHKVRWDGVPTLKLALEMLKEQATRTPEGQWVRVTGGWSPYQFAENRMPTADELNAAVPNRPLFIHYAYNWGFLNKPAMKELGVGTPKFKLSDDTEIEKDKKGNYTGVIRGFTFTFVAIEDMLPGPKPEEELSSLIQVINNLNRFGITSAIDCASIIGWPEGHAPLQTLINENKLNVRFPFVDLGLDIKSNSNWVDTEINRITKLGPISPNQNMHPTMEHGHEYEGTGELIRIDLHDHENFDRPAVIIPREVMMKYAKEDLRKLIEKRIPFRMHLTYDENATNFLDALEEVNKTTPLDGMRWSIEHAETVSMQNVERVKKLGGGIALDSKMYLHGDAFAKTYGREKALYTPRLRAIFDSGVPVSMTSDAFRVSSANPWVAFSWMVTGKSASGSVVLAENNRLTREEALKLYTIGAAWFENEESDKGRIAPGNLGDFAILDADYFTIPDDQIKNLTSVLTVVDGRVVYGAKEYADLTPQLPEILPSWSSIKYFGSYYGEKSNSKN